MRVSSVLKANMPVLCSEKNLDAKELSKNYLFTNPYEKSSSQVLASNVAFMPLSKAHGPVAVINFTGAKDKGSAFYVGAEMPPYFKVGGVATVMNDYKGPHIIPYYNGKIQYDPKTGDPIEDSMVDVHKLDDGTPIFTNQDLDAKPMTDVIKEGNYHKLELVSEKTMNWSLDENNRIMLYKVLPKQSDIDKAIKEGKEPPKAKPHYMVFADGTAKMPRPYADNSYSFGFKKVLGSEAWKGSPYAQFDRAVVELLPEIKDFSPETVVCSDQQCAYIPHYMAQKVLKNDEYYTGMKPSYVMHNVAPGYTGVVSPRDMVVNLAENPGQLKAILKDPVLIESLKNGTADKYYRNLVKETLDDKGNPNATNIPLKYREQGFVSAATTVSEGYADAIVNNEIVAPEIYTIKKRLSDKPGNGGILNPLNDPNVDPYKNLPLPGYGKDQEVEINGVKETIKGMKPFTPEMTLDQMLEVKKENKKNLFNRLSSKYTQNTVLTGLGNRKATLVGTIDPKWTQAIDAGEDVKLFVSWGRGDFQKGLDLVLGAFEKFAKTPEGKNSVLVLGGEMAKENTESQKIKLKVNSMLKDSEFNGRLCLMDGFAPGYALASAADAAILPSRFAPCELTDLEAQKYFCTTIVTNTQGLKQKNFDPSIEAEKAKANAYKTIHEYQMGKAELMKVSPEFKAGYEKLLQEKKTALICRGVESSLLDPLATKNVLKSDEYLALYREHADDILIDELSKCLKAKATQTKEISELMYQNHKNLKTNWDNNQALHPSGKSSEQLYKELHLDPAPQRPTKSLFDFDDSLLAKVKEEVKEEAKNLAGNVADEAKEVVESSKSKMGKGKIAMIAGAVALVGGLGVYAFNQKKKPSGAYTNPNGDSFRRSQVAAN